jgi:16S rRNA pseudouridine516 synthase
MAVTVRLDRLLSSRGYCTRSEVRAFCKSHDVRVAGVPVRRDDDKVKPAEVTIDGQPVDPELLYVLMNKPAGVVCSHDDPAGVRLVYELLPDRWRGRRPAVSTVGRLDADTTGALLLTDDGPLLHRLTSPKHHVPKVYVATLERPLRGDEAATFGSGTLTLRGDDKPLLPASLEPIDATTCRLTLHEGRYHQVRRMFAAVGNHVVALHRERFGLLTVDGMAPGTWRLLTEEDLRTIGDQSGSGT